MRRSAAPSQRASSFKKPCFKAPFTAKQQSKTTFTDTLIESVNHSLNSNSVVINNVKEPRQEDKQKSQVNYDQTRSTSDVLKLLLKSTSEIKEQKEANFLHNLSEEQSKPDVNDFKNKIIASCLDDFDVNKFNIENSSINEKRIDVENDDDNSFPKYFNVMWCKLSKKKYKKWEGDAVMKVYERTVILFDLEGKEISKRSGFKIQETKYLDEGQIIIVGNKECEIQNKLNEDDFTSGKCFLGKNKEIEMSHLSKSQCSAKSFVLPLKNYTKSNKCKKPINSLYANSADKFVMPHPNNSHQWLYNKKQLPVTDVIIDPKLNAVLRSHQKEGVIFLYECILGFRDYGGQGAILADEMGLGKTLQCITLVWTLYKQGPYGGIPILKKILIITPSSLVKNWLKEFKKWLGFDKLSIFAVDQQNKIQEFLHSRLSPVLLISYEMFVRNYELLSDVNFDLIICDEGHRLKNINIKTTNLLMGLQTPRRILLTGTPIQNDLKEFYSIVEFCNPGVLGSSSQFHRIFEEPIIQGRQPNATADVKCLGRDRAQELFSLTSSFVLRRTQEIINKYLPTKLEQVVFCPPTPLQAELYSEILGCQSVKACLTSFSTVDPGHHLMCITAFRKLCNHPLLLYLKSTEAEETNICNTVKDALYQEISSIFPKDFENVNLSVTSGKLKVVSQLLESMFADGRKEKIVLVSHFTQTLDILQKHCKLKGYNFIRLDGSTPTSSRQNIVESFNSPYSNHFIFLLSSKAGGVGLNLIGASRILLYDIDWNPANDLQAMARVWRDGQKKQVFIYRLITAGTIEEKIYQRQITKQNICGAVVDCKEANKVKFSLEELKDLFSFQKDAICLTHDLLKCHCLEEHETLDESLDNEDKTETNVYQLNETPILFNKSIGMSELLKWEHIPGISISDTYQDTYLATCKDDITFIFSNQTKSTSETG